MSGPTVGVQGSKVGKKKKRHEELDSHGVNQQINRKLEWKMLISMIRMHRGQWRRGYLTPGLWFG